MKLNTRKFLLNVLDIKCDHIEFFGLCVQAYISQTLEHFGFNPLGGESNDDHVLNILDQKYTQIYEHKNFYVLDDGEHLWGIAQPKSFLNFSEYPWMVCISEK